MIKWCQSTPQKASREAFWCQVQLTMKLEVREYKFWNLDRLAFGKEEDLEQD